MRYSLSYVVVLSGCVMTVTPENPPRVEGIEEIVQTGERRPIAVDVLPPAHETEEHERTSSITQDLIYWRGTACNKIDYGWAVVAGTDRDFYVTFDCPIGAREYFPIVSAAVGTALHALGKPLVVKRFHSVGTQRYQIVLGMGAIQRAFGENSSLTNWFLSTQGEMRYVR